MDTKRRKVKVRRTNDHEDADRDISNRVQVAFEGWRKTLLSSNPDEIEKRLTSFLPLRKLVSEDASGTLVELKYGELFVKNIIDSSNKDLQISFLFATSDLVDVDDSGILGSNLVHLGLIPEILKILRNVEPRSEYEPRLKPAGICALSSLCLHDMEQTTDLMDHREIELLDSILQVKSMMHLHSRVITFINNVYVSGKFQAALSTQIIPSLMTLLMYNVTNHIKARKLAQPAEESSEADEGDTEDSSDKPSPQQPQQPNKKGGNNYNNANQKNNNATPSTKAAASTPANNNNNNNKGKGNAQSNNNNNNKAGQKQNSAPTSPAKNNNKQTEQESKGKNNNNNKNGSATQPANNNNNNKGKGNNKGNAQVSAEKDKHVESNEEEENETEELTENDFEIDSLYDDQLYNEFIESASYLLGNLTTSVEICNFAEQYSIIDIMTLLFHNTDTTLDALTSVIKCLGNLAHIESNRSKLMESNVLPIGAKLIKLNIDDEMKAQITLLLANMAGFETCTRTLVGAGVIEPIVDLLNTENEDYQRFASLALANMATDITAIPLLMNTQSLKVFVDLCYSNQPYIRRQATRVLNSVASYPTGLFWSALEEASAIPALHYIMNVDQPSDSALCQFDGNHGVTGPSAHLLAKTALGYLQGNGVTAVPLAYPLSQPVLSLYHPLWSDESVNELQAWKEKNDNMTPNTETAEIEKNKGNALFTDKQYKESIDCYTAAILLDENNYAAYSNRAAAYMQLNQWELAFWDSSKCVLLSPDFVKGHFRMGKALVGLDQYGEAVSALSMALKLKKNNKEIRDALQIATLKKKDNVCATIPLHLQRLRACQVMTSLENLTSFADVHHLLQHLFNLFKRYYYASLDLYSKHELMGWHDIVDIEVRLHCWATSVNLNSLMEKMAIAKILFESDLVSHSVRLKYYKDQATEASSPNSSKNKTNEKSKSDFSELLPTPLIPSETDGGEESSNSDNDIVDYSCHHFSYFVTTILSRLVVQGHPKFGLRALKRLILLNSNKLVRDSIGSPLTLSLLQSCGFGGWGLPRLPSLLHVFIHYGGLRCIALDTFEDVVYRGFCAEILADIDIKVWRNQSLSIIHSVMCFFVVPSLSASDEVMKKQGSDVFCKLYTINEIRNTFDEWSKQDSGEFGKFCQLITQRSNELLIKHKLEPKDSLATTQNQSSKDSNTTTIHHNKHSLKIVAERLIELWLASPFCNPKK